MNQQKNIYIWDKLEITYEETNQVKDSKENLLVRDYEPLK